MTSPLLQINNKGITGTYYPSQLRPWLPPWRPSDRFLIKAFGLNAFTLWTQARINCTYVLHTVRMHVHTYVHYPYMCSTIQSLVTQGCIFVRMYMYEIYFFYWRNWRTGKGGGATKIINLHSPLNKKK